MRILTLASILIASASAPAFAKDTKCACDTTCKTACKKGDHKTCKCDGCECSQGKGCKHGKCDHKTHG